MAETKKSVFDTLNAINVNEHTESKNGLTYLSWAWAWSAVKSAYPNATYTVYENADGWNYFTDGKTCWVKTGVTIEGLEHIEHLPIMDFKNKSIPVGNVTSFDVNKAIQRSLTKAVARHGLGLYIYAGEDLPENEAKNENAEAPKKTAPAKKTEQKPTPAPAPAPKTEQFPNRNKFLKICQKNGFDVKAICDEYGLTRNSKDSEFEAAVGYVQMREGQLAVQQVDELAEIYEV